MAKVPRSPWHVRRGPLPLAYAFFISHVNEDSPAVGQLRSAIEDQRPELRCFLDVHNWPLGNDSSWVIKDSLLRSDFMVVWVTPDYLKSRRGWVWVELAYAELLELSLNQGHMDLRFPYIVPILLNVRATPVVRTPLCGYWQRSLVIPTHDATVAEIAQKLIAFYDRQIGERGQ